MSTFVKWSAEVRQRLGDQVLATISRTATDYTCAACDKDGNARRERTSVVVCGAGRTVRPRSVPAFADHHYQ
jgi:hypothetical protein